MAGWKIFMSPRKNNIHPQHVFAQQTGAQKETKPCEARSWWSWRIRQRMGCFTSKRWETPDSLFQLDLLQRFWKNSPDFWGFRDFLNNLPKNTVELETFWGGKLNSLTIRTIDMWKCMFGWTQQVTTKSGISVPTVWMYKNPIDNGLMLMCRKDCNLSFRRNIEVEYLDHLC